MSKKGQLANIGLTALLALMFFMAGMIMLNMIKSPITDARTDLQCSTPAAISDGTKLTCLMVDGVMPYLIITILSIAGGYIIGKFIA